MAVGSKTTSSKSGKPKSVSNAAGPQVSNPDKVFWPDEGYTKGNLADFYREVFPVLKPFVDDRILTLERCPDGMRGNCFYQKEKPDSIPAGTPTKRLPPARGAGEATRSS